MTYSRWTTVNDIYAYDGPDGEIVMHVIGDRKTYMFSEWVDFVERLIQLKVEGVAVPEELIKGMDCFAI